MRWPSVVIQKILIADEPTTALDVTVQRAILELIRDLQQQSGMSCIFISHDLGVIAEICDEVAVMYKGEIVERGSVKLIFNHPNENYNSKSDRMPAKTGCQIQGITHHSRFSQR